ncbi:hypothetical protein LEP1GSC175_3117 [Leptospira santarosai str. HAI821]|nr:hypothetical protein LEP1GSC175_3117 [Leptospira santarosai str. HAI821]
MITKERNIDPDIFSRRYEVLFFIHLILDSVDLDFYHGIILLIVPDIGKQFYRNVLFSFWQPVSKKLLVCHFSS